MAVDLERFAADVDALAERWARLGMSWMFGPVHPNFGKACIAGEFQSPNWGGELIVWVTGEAELAGVRFGDGWSVNKHYDLTTLVDLRVALTELERLVAKGHSPVGAVTEHR